MTTILDPRGLWADMFDVSFLSYPWSKRQNMGHIQGHTYTFFYFQALDRNVRVFAVRKQFFYPLTTTFVRSGLGSGDLAEKAAITHNIKC